MKGPSTTPGKIKAVLIICIVGAIVALGFNFLVYTASRNVSQIIGKDTVPSIVAANHINALLSSAHSNAMNAMVTDEKSGGRFWTLYRKNMIDLHSELLDISKNITFGDTERRAILAIMSNVSEYEYTLGGAVSDGARISVDQFGEANRLMQQKILPASVTLDNIYLSSLDTTYNSYTGTVNIALILMVIIGIIFLAFLILSQIYLFKRTHRIMNIGLALSSILVLVNIIYSANALNSVKSDLYTAKHDAFDSIQALWSARATAYNANALESLYLLHDGTGIVQTADTINFNLSASRLCSDTKEALSGGKFEGFLSDELNNITFDGEKEAADDALKCWAKYVDIDKEIRSLEYDSKLSSAISLNVGEASGQSDYEFAQFDASLGKAIDINQANFDYSMDSAYRTLGIFPYATLAFLILIILLSMFGLRPRLEEYKA